MVSEAICLDVIKFARGRQLVLTTTFHPGEPVKQTYEDSFTESQLYRYLLTRYPISEIDAALRWLGFGNYLSESSGSLRGPFWKTLSPKGCSAADAGCIPEEDRPLLYQEQRPHEVFVAHQFNEEDSALVTYLRERVLVPAGFTMVDGRAEGLEDFRTSILTKIKRARYFLCLLTKRIEFTGGDFASSVWLYQETGVAVAFGKRPILLVEDSIHPQYIGELQSIYEHVPFTRSNHPLAFERVLPRLIADLRSNHIPVPSGTRSE